MGANQLFACRQSGAWTTYKVALLCFMAYALSGCGKWVQVHQDKDYSPMLQCTDSSGRKDPPPVDDEVWIQSLWYKSFEGLNQCVTGLVKHYVHASGKNKKAALEHQGFTCPKTKEDMCFWTTTMSRYGKNEEKEGMTHVLTKITVDLKKNTIAITRSTAFEDGHYLTLYNKTHPF